MRTLFFFLIGSAVFGLSGCAGGSDSVEMADVSGVITLKGEPLADAEVTFVAGKYQGYGRTDEQGRYTLVRGAPVGECKVYITKAPTSEAGVNGIDLSVEGMDEEQIRAMQEAQGISSRKEEALLPPEFSDPEKTKLTFIVPSEGTDQADFKL